jgi:hypothetical protein
MLLADGRKTELCHMKVKVFRNYSDNLKAIGNLALYVT